MVVHVIMVVHSGMQSNIKMQTFEVFQRVYFLEKYQNAQVYITTLAIPKPTGG